jgi:hypothetical protein
MAFQVIMVTDSFNKYLIEYITKYKTCFAIVNFKENLDFWHKTFHTYKKIVNSTILNIYIRNENILATLHYLRYNTYVVNTGMLGLYENGIRVKWNALKDPQLRSLKVNEITKISMASERNS